MLRHWKQFRRVIFHYFWRRYLPDAKGPRMAWLIYSLVGTSLIVFCQLSHDPDPILEVFIVSIYAFPSWLIFYVVAPFISPTGSKEIFLEFMTWILMVSVNGWLVYRIFCRFRVRPDHVPKGFDLPL